MWAIGRYKGKQANYIAGLAHEGIGYLLLEQDGRGDNKTVVVAFHPSLDGGPFPHHLEQVRRPEKIAEYDRRWRAMKGMRES